MTNPRRLGPAQHPSRPRRNQVAALSEDGPEWLVVPSKKDRSLLAEHANAVSHYITTGDPRRLARFKGAYLVLTDSSRFELVTDLATIDRLAEGGELHYEFYRR